MVVLHHIHPIVLTHQRQMPLQGGYGTSSGPIFVSGIKNIVSDILVNYINILTFQNLAHLFYCQFSYIAFHFDMKTQDRL